jgi:hypothetical protein
MEVNYGWTEVRISEQSEDVIAEPARSLEIADIDIEPEDARAENSVTMIWEIADWFDGPSMQWCSSCTA